MVRRFILNWLIVIAALVMTAIALIVYPVKPWRRALGLTILKILEWRIE